MANYGLNDLQFNIDTLELDIRETLRKYLRKDEVTDYFGSEVYIVPMEVDLVDKSKLPAIEITVSDEGAVRNAQEDTQIQYMNDFMVEINTYTTGEDKRQKNIKLANFVVDILQTSQKLSHFYNRGLRITQHRELSSITEGVNRRIIRLSGRCDNNQKLIYSI